MVASEQASLSAKSTCLQSGLCVPLAVRLRSTEAKVQDVQIANRRYDESVVNADMVSNHSLYQWQNRASNDGHVEDA